MPTDNADQIETQGFPPVARTDARILVLGSLPSQRSVREQEYYAHPQNAFWRIMRDIAGAEGSYTSRCQALVEKRIALWDVLAASVRPGSMDADIRMDSAQVNDFDAFFRAHPQLSRICFNGRKAADMFDRLVAPGLTSDRAALIVLPSTSPAYASMRFEDKLRRWREALDLTEGG
jgi:hypoxanthine-DNA glycosylase